MSNTTMTMRRLICGATIRAKYSQTRRSFASSTTALSSPATSTPASTDTTLGFSTSSLGLERSWIQPVRHDIKQLPEVEKAWSIFPSLSSVDNLRRATDVFSSYAPGGKEHLAVYALRAECQQRLGLYSDAVLTIEELSSIVADDHTSGGTPSSSSSSPPQNYHEDLILAKAKACWFGGNFDQSLSLCESIISTYNDLEETFPTTNLHMASAMTGKALSQLSAMGSLDDAYSVRDYFRVTNQFLQRHPPQSNSLPVAAAHSNAGIAEAVYNIFIEETNGVSMPITTALKTWFQGVQKITGSGGGSDTQPTPQLVAASKMLEATIQANLAWGVLTYEDDRSDRLSKASEYAKKALAVYDPTEVNGDDNNKSEDSLLLIQGEGLPRVLTVVASCYKEAESAVTAEGLFQSASDRKNLVHPSTLTKLQLKDALMRYSDLCHEWEKRESNAKRLLVEAEEIDNSLPPHWKGKSGLLGSAWFWTPGEMV
mmetsp:Transcript_46926/g.114459  ORF Transcript_46926/g.114459 Transcript_46926/m.114459 type:complete len:484 (+) Transcript_46926:73-1524(+)